MALHYTATHCNTLQHTATHETKSGGQLISGNIGLEHNNHYYRRVSSHFMRTGAGIDDQKNSQGQRIGDKITLCGVSFKMMLEIDERFTDVRVRMMRIRCVWEYLLSQNERIRSCCARSAN